MDSETPFSHSSDALTAVRNTPPVELADDYSPGQMHMYNRMYLYT